jgi:hypothetical protein
MAVENSHPAKVRREFFVALRIAYPGMSLFNSKRGHAAVRSSLNLAG